MVGDAVWLLRHYAIQYDTIRNTIQHYAIQDDTVQMQYSTTDKKQNTVQDDRTIVTNTQLCKNMMTKNIINFKTFK